MENLEKNLLNAKISMEEVGAATKKFGIITIDNFLFKNDENVIYIYSHYSNIKNCLDVSFDKYKEIDMLKFEAVYCNKKYSSKFDLVNLYNEINNKINETFYNEHESCEYLKQKKELLKTGYYDSNKWSIEEFKYHLIYNYIYKNGFNDNNINIDDFILRDAIKILKNKDNYINSNLELLNEGFKDYEAKSEEEKKYIFKGWHVPYAIKILNNCFEQKLRNKLIEEIKSNEKIQKIKNFVDFINNLDEKIKNIKIVFADGKEETRSTCDACRYDFLNKEINNIKAIKHGKKTLKEF